MSRRYSAGFRYPTAARFEHFKREDESQTSALARLLDAAGVPEVDECEECEEYVANYVRFDDATVLCPEHFLEASDVDADEIELSAVRGGADD